MMKRVMSLGLSLALAISLAACSGSVSEAVSSASATAGPTAAPEDVYKRQPFRSNKRSSLSGLPHSLRHPRWSPHTKRPSVLIAATCTFPSV